MKVKNGKLYRAAAGRNICIDLYRIGPDPLIRRREERSCTHNLLPEGSEKPAVCGYEMTCEAFV